MGKRVEPVHKKIPDVLADLLAGHREAGLQGPPAVRKYLDRTVTQQHSLPNAVKGFAYDLLSQACVQTDSPEQAVEAAIKARSYVPQMQEDLPRELKAWDWLCFEAAITALVDLGRFEEALEWCNQAVAAGMGNVYERKADSIRWMT